jgi:hypothetical protein
MQRIGKVSSWRALRATCVVLALGAGLAGCVVQDQRPIPPVVAQKATVEIPQDELLDVGIHMFDPNIPQDPAEQEKRRIYPDVRKACCATRSRPPANGARCGCCLPRVPAATSTSTHASWNPTAGNCSLRSP